MRLVAVSVWSLLICLYGSHAYILLVSILTEPNIWLLVYLSHISSKIFVLNFNSSRLIGNGAMKCMDLMLTMLLSITHDYITKNRNN